MRNDAVKAPDGAGRSSVVSENGLSILTPTCASRLRSGRLAAVDDAKRVVVATRRKNRMLL